MGFAGAVLRFFIIFNSNWGKDEPQTLRYAITQNCSMGADGGHITGALGPIIHQTAQTQKAPQGELVSETAILLVAGAGYGEAPKIDIAA
jgi:hypothetical protein